MNRGVSLAVVTGLSLCSIGTLHSLSCIVSLSSLSLLPISHPCISFQSSHKVLSKHESLSLTLSTASCELLTMPNITSRAICRCVCVKGTHRMGYGTSSQSIDPVYPIFSWCTVLLSSSVYPFSVISPSSSSHPCRPLSTLCMFVRIRFSIAREN